MLCSDVSHPVNVYLSEWVDQLSVDHNIRLARSRADLTGGDFLFLVSCSELINAEDRRSYRHSLVLHASDLPEGRGWSPHVWSIVNGAEVINLSLLEAEDKVDSGRIWLKCRIPVKRNMLWYEVNDLLFAAEIELMTEAVECYDSIEPYPQDPDIKPTYYPKRTPQDSEIDPCLSIVDQFNLIRMCDPIRYPAWFELHGRKYKVIVEKMDHERV